MVEWAKELGNELKSYGLQLQQYAGEVNPGRPRICNGSQQPSSNTPRNFQQYANELNDAAVIGSTTRSLGAALGLLNIAGLGNSLPVNAYAVLNLIEGRSYGQGGLPEISGVLSSLPGLTAGAYSANHVYTPTDASWASQELISNANSIAGEQGAAQAAVGDLQAHAAALQALRDHLATSSSPKDVQDTQAQIGFLEEVWTANELAQLTAINAAYAAEKDAREQRANEELDQEFAVFGQAAEPAVPASNP